MGKIEKQIKGVFKKALKPIFKIINPILKAVKSMSMAVKCSIKLIMNAPKCFIFYWLDMIKYTLLYLPILILMGLLGLAKEWKPLQKTLDKFIGWPNSTLNRCYRCKNKKMKDSGFLERLKKMMKAKDGQGDNNFSFFSFLMVCLIAGAIGYRFWFTYLKKKKQETQ